MIDDVAYDSHRALKKGAVLTVYSYRPEAGKRRMRWGTDEDIMESMEKRNVCWPGLAGFFCLLLVVRVKKEYLAKQD